MAARHWLTCGAATLILAATFDGPSRAQVKKDVDQLLALERQLRESHRQGQNSQALPVAERYLSLAREHYGEESANLATAFSVVANIYRALGRHTDAERLYKDSFAIKEKVFGPEHTEVGTATSNLAGLYMEMGRHPEAEALLIKALAIREKALGTNHADVGSTLSALGRLRRDQRRFAEAEALYKRALANHEAALGGEHNAVARDLGNLADLYRDLGRPTEAEPLYKRAVAIYEKSVGPDHASAGITLGHLAEVYRAQRRYAEAEPLYKRALAIVERASGPESINVATNLNNLALLYRDQRRFSEVQSLLARSIAIFETVRGGGHPSVGVALGLLADNYRSQGRAGDAEASVKRALAIHERALDPDHPHIATSLVLLSLIYRQQRRFEEAEPLLLRAVAIQEKVYGENAPNLSRTIAGLASMALARKDYQRASDYYRRSTSLMLRRADREAQDATGSLTGRGKSEAESLSWQFAVLTKVMYRLARDRVDAAVAMRTEMFQTAQWAMASDAAQSLAQMAARSVKSDPALAAVVRERQDLIGEWQNRDAARSAALAFPPNQRDAAGEAANAARLAAIDARISEIDERMKTQFPDYASLARAQTLSVEDVQRDLRADEALVLFLDTLGTASLPEETFIWVVTKLDVRLTRSALGSSTLKREVAALRCGLDRSAWDSPGDACATLLNILPGATPKGPEPLPFDLPRAHKLYQSLLGPVAELIQDKHLLVVPSGALTQLPLQILLTQPANSSQTGVEAFRSAAWLTRSNAITVLPAVSSIRALRRHAKTSRATKQFIGLGNPLLDGDPVSRPWEVEWAKLAREKHVCPRTTWKKQVSLLERRGVHQVPIRSGRADLKLLLSQSPLHETADELCAVAKDLGLASDDVLLGGRATEGTVKKLSREGELASYRILHFATHGTVAGEMEGTNEPGLILTPPRTQSNEDDGFLTATEVAALKLDADWVILSACNTAAGGSDQAEALSGLARAFFYAGARSLLVSHWAVVSVATVKLITHAVGATAGSGSLGRAQALRQAMLNMIETGEAHPAFWAPFVVVGEGAVPH